eukprot:11972402-Alexandrium_andersonii.AAC.1
MGRAKALPAHSQRMPAAQFGSLQGRSTERAAHAVRGFPKLAEKKRASAAVLIDVPSASYVVLRPL